MATFELLHPHKNRLLVRRWDAAKGLTACYLPAPSAGSFDKNTGSRLRGLFVFPPITHGLRRGLHSFAASRLHGIPFRAMSSNSAFQDAVSFIVPLCTQTKRDPQFMRVSKLLIGIEHQSCTLNR
jgi:hypothetical protein